MKRIIRPCINVIAVIFFAVTTLQAAERNIPVEMIYVKGGCFQMGSNDSENDEKPLHEVCVSDFAMGKYEVTRGQWQAVMGSNPSYFDSGGADCPVENVSWNDVQEFIGNLNRLTGKKYRLPTEAEWEYAACSGGKKEKYSGTNDQSRLMAYAWYCENSDVKTRKVGTRMPNGLGIYDMSGNVWEWVEDVYGNYSSHGRNNPINTKGTYRVIRGGGWDSVPSGVRVVNRSRYNPGRRGGDVGFRLASTP